LDGLSNARQYKLAGNGLSINVVSEIFKELLFNECDIERNEVQQQKKLDFFGV